MTQIIKLYRDEDLDEVCLICKRKTGVSKKQPIEDRYGYIQGAGQLCYDCYQDYKEEDM